LIELDFIARHPTLLRHDWRPPRVLLVRGLAQEYERPVGDAGHASPLDREPSDLRVSEQPLALLLTDEADVAGGCLNCDSDPEHEGNGTRGLRRRLLYFVQ
jgi:hypothetical protein